MDCNLFQMANNTEYRNTSSTVSLWYGIWSCIGIILVLSVLFSTIIQKGSRLTSFYIFLMNLNVANLCMFFIYFTYVVPCVASGSQLYGTLVGRFYAYFQSITFTTIVQNCFLISLNRSLTVCHRKIHDKIFSLKISKTLTLATWLFAALLSVFDSILSYQSYFLEKIFVFSQICTKISAMVTLRAFVSYICIYCVAFFYVFAGWKLRKSKHSMSLINRQVSYNMSKYQMNMFYQAACIWLALLANAIGFTILAFVLQGVPAVMVGAVLVLGNSYSASVCTMIFSKDIRKRVKAIFCKIREAEEQTTCQQLPQNKQLVVIPMRSIREITTIS